MSFIYTEKLQGSNGNGNSSSNGSDKDKSNNGNGNSSSVSNGNGSGNGNGNNNNGNGNNVNHGSNNGNNGLHLGWYKRPDQPNNPGNQDPLDNTSNYVNDISIGNPQVLMTSDKNGNYTGAYTYGLDRISADNLTADSKDNPLYYLYDGRGSVGQLINSSGEVKNSYSYDPFGATDHDGPLGNSKAHYQDYFGFNGEEFNNISGLQYLRARYYEADSGRFLTRDSYMGNTMDPLSLNRYDYALNNPVMNIDPSGHRALAVDEDGVAAITQRYGTLRNGSSDNTQRDVSLLQTMLNTAGFNPGTIDGIFGNNTEKAVRAYQASKDLTLDGIVGKQTWDSLGGKVTASSTASNSNELPMLRKGSSNKDAIKKLQLALIDQHYDLGPSGADGIFGNKTVQAVLNFQWDKHLSIDGIYGSQTRGALSEQGKACDGKDYVSSQGTSNDYQIGDGNWLYDLALGKGINLKKGGSKILWQFEGVGIKLEIKLNISAYTNSSAPISISDEGVKLSLPAGAEVGLNTKEGNLSVSESIEGFGFGTSAGVTLGWPNSSISIATSYTPSESAGPKAEIEANITMNDIESVAIIGGTTALTIATDGSDLAVVLAALGGSAQEAISIIARMLSVSPSH